jgi:heterodisulfide reductase subunit B
MKEVVADLSHKILESARSAGANIIATACPLCEFNLGNRQSEVQKRYPNSETIPVVYFTQLMAAAFGLSEEEQVLGMSKPDPRPFLQKMELI